MKPIHIYISASVIVGMMVVTPFAYDFLREVYPKGPLGALYDKCEREMSSFNRWDKGERALCKVVKGS